MESIGVDNHIKDIMKLLLEMLTMTSQCNLRCSYCDWNKDAVIELNQAQIKTAYKNLDKVKQMLDEKYPDVKIVQYSGGEPLMFPELFYHVLDLFEDKWIRINTNGTLITDEVLEKVKEHGKTYVAISLDGISYEPNKARFGSNKKGFEKVIQNIDKIICNQIPLMLLCTLNEKNIDYFPEFVETLSHKYSKAIENGLLVLPTHAVTSYSRDNGAASIEQIRKFENYVEKNINKYPILNNIKGHYKNLVNYLLHSKRLYDCSIYDWSLSVHFRKNDIISNGKFLSFGCGMRGVHELGYFNVNEKEDINVLSSKVRNYNRIRNSRTFKNENQVSEFNNLNDNCEGKCFPDWVMFDLVFSGRVSMEEAEKWFVVFRDPDVKKTIYKYQVNLQSERLSEKL